MIHKKILSIVCVVFAIALIFTLVKEIANAQGGTEQAFGNKDVTNADGMKADVWTGQQLNTKWFRASPVGVCTSNSSPCAFGSGFVETGWLKGRDYNNNILNQYSTWESPNGNYEHEYQLGMLNDNTWYTFEVYYKASTNPKWIVRRDGLQSLVITNDPPNFTSGGLVSCGAEGGKVGINMDVYCASMNYRQVGGAWTLFDFVGIQKTPNYCVDKPFDFGLRGWGPC